MNKDTIPDDLILLFSAENCSSSFMSHLFSQEVRHLYSEEIVPRGVSYRLSPTSYLMLPTTLHPPLTLAQSMQASLASLVRTLAHSVPHFIQCIRPSRSSTTTWDTSCVREQVRQLEVTEMVARRAGALLGWRTREEWGRKYGMLGDCQEVMEKMKDECEEVIVGVEDIFYSDKVRKMLGRMRKQKMEESAIIIQQGWRQYKLNRVLTIYLAGLQVLNI